MTTQTPTLLEFIAADDQAELKRYQRHYKDYTNALRAGQTERAEYHKGLWEPYYLRLRVVGK